MRRLVPAAVLLAVALPVALTEAAATESVSGRVPATIGVQVDLDGMGVSTDGTQPSTITTERRGDTLVVTVIPSL